jgi:hypothetical protein
MSKVIFWIVVIFAMLFALRLFNAAKARRRTDASRRSAETDVPAAEPMVRCVRCGVFLPKADATPAPGGHACADTRCARNR